MKGAECLHIGQKIRQVRLSRGLTQSALCGDMITRNMLSLIENGSASPSVKTLMYIAEKLDVPAGYLISDDSVDAENEYLKLHIIGNVRSALKNGDYTECIRLCDSMIPDHDDEINLILAECHINLAMQSYESGHFSSAKEHMSKAVTASGNTIYNTSDIKNKCGLLSVVINDAESQSPVPPYLYLFNDENSFIQEKGYIRASSLITQGKLREAEIVMEECGVSEKSGVFYEHLMIKILIQNENYQNAFIQLTALIKKYRSTLTAYMQYKIYDDIEYCCKVTGDFKTAYEFSTKKLELMSLSKK